MILTEEESALRLALDIEAAHKRHAARLARIKSWRESWKQTGRVSKKEGVQSSKADIFRLHQSGLQPKDIAKMLGVSRATVYKHLSADNQKKAPHELPCRARNVLLNSLGTIDPAAVSQATSVKSLSETANCGKRSIADIAMWLDAHGFRLKEN